MILSIFLSLLITSFVTSLLVILFALFSRSFPRLMSSRTRYTIWVLILLSLLIPIKPLLGNGFFTLTLPHVIKPTAVNEVPTLAAKLSETNSTLPAIQLILYLLCLVWIVGIFVSLVRHVAQYLKFRHLIQRAGQQVTDKETLKLFEDLRDCMQIKNKHMILLRCNFIKSPMLTGFRQPVILLPEQEFSEQQMEIILEHELTHYLHRDLLINLLMIIATSLHWFNPIIRFANRVIQEEGEILCDESVLRGKNLNYRRFYGKTILSLIESGEPKSIALSTHFFESKMNLQHRLIAILDTHNPKKRLSYLTLTFSLLTVFLFNSIFVFATTIDNNQVSQRTSQRQEHLNKNQRDVDNQNNKTLPSTSNANTSNSSANEQTPANPATSESNPPVTTVPTPAVGNDANAVYHSSAPSAGDSDEADTDSDNDDENAENEVEEADD